MNALCSELKPELALASVSKNKIELLKQLHSGLKKKKKKKKIYIYIYIKCKLHHSQWQSSTQDDNQ